jgi:hypothetical protein
MDKLSKALLSICAFTITCCIAALTTVTILNSAIQPPAAPSEKQRFVLIERTGYQRMMILDTATGRTWRYYEPSDLDGQSIWLPIRKFDDIQSFRAFVKKREAGLKHKEPL